MTALLRFALLYPLLLLLHIHQVISSSDYLPLVGTACNPNNTRLLLDNNQLKSDCGYVAWCDTSDNTCKARGCRRDEYPFGYNTVERSLWPPLCSEEQFCPDEGSSCINKVGLGQGCQLNRDDECVQSASPAGVKCLHNICVGVDASLGSNCTYENTIYTDYTDRNNNYGDIISRDNCMSGLYCDAPTTQCKQQLNTGGSCSADKECITGYCFDKTFLATLPVNNNYTGSCGEDPIKVKSRVYVYVLIAIFIIAALVGLGVWLVKVHLRQTKAKKAAREEYWQGQKSISGKARLIDASIRSNSDPFITANHPLLANLRLSSQSTTATVNSTTPLKKGSKLQHQQRYSDHLLRYDSSANNSPYNRSIDFDYAAGQSSSDNFLQRDSFVTPTQSLSNLNLQETLASPLVGPSAATSSAVEALTSTSDYVRSRDNARSRTDQGWQSPDHRLG